MLAGHHSWLPFPSDLRSSSRAASICLFSTCGSHTVLASVSALEQRSLPMWWFGGVNRLSGPRLGSIGHSVACAASPRACCAVSAVRGERRAAVGASGGFPMCGGHLWLRRGTSPKVNSLIACCARSIESSCISASSLGVKGRLRLSVKSASMSNTAPLASPPSGFTPQTSRMTKPRFAISSVSTSARSFVPSV